MTYPELWSAETEARVRAAARDLDRQDRPEAVTFCNKCVISNQRPRITFDAEGVCSACRYAERKRDGSIDWEARRAELERKLDMGYRNRTGGYDVIVPASGGKDSAFVAWTLRHEFGMHPLLVRWAPFMVTDVGERNWHRLLNHFDGVTIQPNATLHRKLARLAFEFVGDPFLPFIYGQMAAPMRVAREKGIMLVMGGENGEAEYGGDTAANDRPAWDMADWERVYQKGNGIRDLLDLGRNLGAISDDEAACACHYYWPPPVNGDAYPEYRWLGYHLPWHPQGNYYDAVEHFGFEANPERSEGTHSKYASIDDKLDGLHYYMGFVKFGIGRCTSDAAHEVRDGDITRDEAVDLVKRYDGEFPVKHLDECLDYLGMDRDQLHRVFDRFRPAHLWEPYTVPTASTDPENGAPAGAVSEWRLKHSVDRCSPSA